VIDETLELIKAAVPGVTVYDGITPQQESDLPNRYVVLYPDTPIATTGDVGVTANGDDFSFQVTCVAIDGNDQSWRARWLAGKIRDTLTRSRASPTSGKYRHVSSSPAARDEQVMSRRAVVTMDRYRVRR